MVCEVKQISSNVTSLHIAEEECVGKLPTTPVWKEKEPNSYSDFGLETTFKERSPITNSRQDKKGSITSFDGKFGYNTDLTQEAVQDAAQGFLYADAREKASTKPFNGSYVALTALTTSEVQAASGLDVFKANDLVVLKNNANSENNGLALVTAATATTLTLDKTLTAEASPSPTAYVDNCGYQFAAGEISLAASSNAVTLSSSGVDLTTLGLNVGETIGIGGDAANTFLASNTQGYGRIRSISATQILLDDTTFTATTDAGTGVTLQIFFGKFIRNEKNPSLIKKRSYQAELQLGEDSVGVQSQYLLGSGCNEMKINIPTEDFVTVDLGFISIDSEERTGTDGLKTGSREGVFANDVYNTSSNLYRSRVSVNSDSAINNSDLFAYALSGEVTINNGISLVKALGTAGGIDFTEANFKVSGSLEVYFANVSALQAAKNNSEVNVNFILALKNQGIVLDMPTVSISTSTINVEKDNSLKLPIDFAAYESDKEFTMSMTFLPYLPQALMPVV